MRSLTLKASLALASTLFLALFIACNGDSNGAEPAADDSDSSGNEVVDFELPEDFPEYPGLEVVRSFQLGDHVVLEGHSTDPAADVLAFYQEAFTQGRWEIVDSESVPGQDDISFAATGPSVSGKVAVGEDSEVPGRTVVAIAVAAEEDEE